MESESLLMNSMEPTKFDKIEMVKIKVEWCVKDMFFMPSEYAETHADEEKAKCRLTVYVQSSNLETINTLDFNGKIIILTVHDVGTNPLNSFIPMINMKMESIAEFREKIFLHLCVPGQENGANNFDGSFPTMEQMAEIIPQVLGHFRVKKCIALGEGAGADIICRFAMEYPEMLEGILLIHSTSSTHGFIENIKEILTNFQIEDGKMNGVGWDYLLAHRFGEDSKRNHRQHWIDQIRRNGLNEHNLSRYLYNFSYRSDFTDMLKKNLLRVRTVLVTGSKSPHNKSVYHMFEELDKTISAILVADDVLDVVKEAPEYIGQGISLLLSDQLPQMPMPTQLVERQNSNNTFTNVQKCFDRIVEFFCHGERRTRNGPTLQMRV